MPDSSKEKARKQLLFALGLLVVASAGYLVTSHFAPQQAQEGTTSTVPGAGISRPVVISGKQVCLAHRDTSGPQTLECAIGFRSDEGTSYALDANSAVKPFDLPADRRITIAGTFVPVEALNTDQWQKYDVAGIITVDSFQQI